MFGKEVEESGEGGDDCGGADGILGLRARNRERGNGFLEHGTRARDEGCELWTVGKGVLDGEVEEQGDVEEGDLMRELVSVL